MQLYIAPKWYLVVLSGDDKRVESLNEHTLLQYLLRISFPYYNQSMLTYFDE